MNDEAGQSVLFENLGNFELPKGGGILIENVKKGVVLSGGDRQFQDLADKVRHHGTTAAALWIEMRCIGHGHVVRKIECVVPCEIAIEGSRAKPEGAEGPAVLINAADPLEEQGLADKQLSVVIQIVHIDFKPSRTKVREKRGTKGVALLRNQLKGAGNAITLIDIHESLTEIPTVNGFHIVGDDRAAREPVRPKPDERDFFTTASSDAKAEQRLVYLLDGRINGPAWKRDGTPIRKPEFLEVTADANTEEGSSEVIKRVG